MITFGNEEQLVNFVRSVISLKAAVGNLQTATAVNLVLMIMIENEKRLDGEPSSDI